MFSTMFINKALRVYKNCIPMYYEVENQITIIDTGNVYVSHCYLTLHVTQTFCKASLQ